MNEKMGEGCGSCRSRAHILGEKLRWTIYNNPWKHLRAKKEAGRIKGIEEKHTAKVKKNGVSREKLGVDM